MELTVLYPNAGVLVAAIVLDLIVGDPHYPAHPVRLIGRSIGFLERRLRALGFDGYGGGITLCVLVAIFWCGIGSALVLFVDRWNHGIAFVLHGLLVYSMLALRDLFDHARAVERAVRERDLPRARSAASRLVSRDTGHLSFAECRRAGIESIGENLTDGFVSPLFWYVVGGLPGMIAFKVFSTLDSMVGYKSERYIRFGRCGARVDDILNWLPARMTWALIAFAAVFVPRCSAGNALRVGWFQHAILPSPNSGWGEAAIAGAIQRRLVGPIRKNGVVVTDAWLGEGSDPPAGDDVKDMGIAITLSLASGLIAALLCVTAIVFFS